MGIEMLINAVLKAMGYDRETFEAKLKELRDEVTLFAKRAEQSEKDLAECKRMLQKLVGETPTDNPPQFGN